MSDTETTTYPTWHGRTRHASTATTRITLKSTGYKTIGVLEGGMIDLGPRGFTVYTLHPNGVDIEHDSAYYAIFEGAGFTFQHMLPSGFVAEGTLIKANFWLDDPAADAEPCSCDEDHVIIDYMPPSRTFNPGVVIMNVEFLA